MQKSFTGDGAGAAKIASVAYLTGAKKDAFPHVNALPDRDPPKFPGKLLTNSNGLRSDVCVCVVIRSMAGNFKDFAAGKGDSIAQQLRNKIKKCPNCGKPNAYLLSNVCELQLLMLADRLPACFKRKALLFDTAV